MTVVRTRFAKLLVGLTGVLIVGLAILFAVVQNPADEVGATAANHATPVATSSGIAGADATSSAAGSATVARGRAVYREQRCRMCHSIGGDGNPRSPLDGVGSRLTEVQIRLWIVAPQEMNPTVAKPGYLLSIDDLNALVAYLMANQP